MKLLQYLCLMTVISIFASCAKQSSSEKKARDSLIFALDTDVISLDPHGSNDTTSSIAISTIYDSILDLDPETLEVTSGLAKTWKQIDDLTWEFELFEGIKFHNGDPLTIEDIRFTVERGKKSPKVTYIFREMDKVQKVSEKVFRIITKEPFVPLIAHLTHTNTGILSKRAVTESGKDYGVKIAIGTGSFKLKKVIKSTSVTLVRNEDYFQTPAKLAKVEYRIIPDAQARSFAIESGDVDIVIKVPALGLKELEKNPDLVVRTEPTLRCKYIGMNHKTKYLKDQKVRLAISHAIDAQAIIDAPEIENGLGTVPGAPLSPLVFGYSEIEPYAYDPELAKQILDEAGYPVGADGIRFPLEILTSEGIRKSVATYVQAFLKEVGIDLEVKTLEWGALLEKTTKGDSEMFVLGWTTSTADANHGLFSLYHSTQQGNGGKGFYYNDRVDQLLDAAKAETNRTKRKELYAQTLKILTADAVVFPYSYPVHTAVLRKEIKGFKLQPDGHHKIYSAYIE